jgi:hypothetical protein
MDELSVIFTDCKRSRALVEALAAVLYTGDRVAAGPVFSDPLAEWDLGKTAFERVTVAHELLEVIPLDRL